MTSSAVGANRVFNFNAGPSALPLAVLERVRQELLDWHGSGMSVMEMSHRSPEFEGINAAAEAGLRRHLGIPDGYAVLFLQGGATLQFSQVPMNLCLPEKPVDLVHTGTWTAKALGELKKGFPHRLAASTEAEKFMRVPRPEEISLSPDASYVHLCSNNTIEGTQFTVFPETGAVPLVADMSSDIISRHMDVTKFGLIFAGAQKNLGPSGVTIVIVRKDLAERAGKNLPSLLQYRSQIKEHSLFNTPPTFAIYIVGLMMEWIAAEGGLPAIEKRNDAKATLLYDAIDASGGFYTCPVERGSRSKMNVVFRVGTSAGASRSASEANSGSDSGNGNSAGNDALEKKFGHEAAAAGMVGTPGHRSVGGMRVSLYNAVTLEAVTTLVAFMREFQRKQG